MIMFCINILNFQDLTSYFKSLHLEIMILLLDYCFQINVIYHLSLVLTEWIFSMKFYLQLYWHNYIFFSGEEEE